MVIYHEAKYDLWDLTLCFACLYFSVQLIRYSLIKDFLSGFLNFFIIVTSSLAFVDVLFENTNLSESSSLSMDNLIVSWHALFSVLFSFILALGNKFLTNCSRRTGNA